MIRSGNEDNFTVDTSPTRGIFIVADGMGGHAAGEVASEMAVQIVQRELAGVKKQKCLAHVLRSLSGVLEAKTRGARRFARRPRWAASMRRGW